MSGTVDLGAPGGPASATFAVNGDASVIVGSALASQSTGSDAAFRWTAKSGMQDLMKLVNASQRLILHNAIGVSHDDILITGDGLNPKLGVDEPWRAVLPHS